MGVKGLTSLLSSDKRRFGHAWRLSPCSTTSQANLLYIDGPALMHHLMKPDDMFFLDRFYCRCKDFFIKLVLAGAKELHLVMDGLAGSEKQCEQLRRLGIKAQIMNEFTKYLIRQSHGVSGCKSGKSCAPHLFSEHIFVEAFEDAVSHLQLRKEVSETKHSDRKCVVGKTHFAPAEAEMHIAALLYNISVSGALNVSSRCVVLSNDSDFLIYPSCPGFVSLKSLEVYSNHSSVANEKDSKLDVNVSGWFYSQSNFCRAFDIPVCALPVFSLLAGCDYLLLIHQEKQLEIARKKIVTSNVGGLRQSDRNKPSSKACVLAILRYVRHCRDKNEGRRLHLDDNKSHTEGNGDNLIQEKVALTLAGEGIGKEERFTILLSAFQHVMILYDNPKNHPHLKVSSGKSIDACDFPINVDIQRIVRHGIFYCRPILERIGTSTENKSEQDRYLIEKELKLGDGSLWKCSRFAEMRRRIYTVLNTAVGNTSGGSISEYCCRAGQALKEQVVFPRSSTHFSTLDTILVGANGFTNMSQEDALITLDYCIEGAASNCLATLPKDLHVIFLSSLLLPTRCISRLMTCICGAFPPDKSLPFCTAVTDVFIDAHFVNVTAFIQLAMYHASLLAWLFPSLFCVNQLSFRSIFSKSLIFEVWENRKGGVNAEDLLECILNRHVLDKEYQATANEWQGRVKALQKSLDKYSKMMST